MSTYSKDHTRLMANVVRPDLVAGYVVENYANMKERLYAVTHEGTIYTRTASLGTSSFNGGKWHETDTVPANAEYIGQYPLALTK